LYSRRENHSKRREERKQPISMEEKPNNNNNNNGSIVGLPVVKIATSVDSEEEYLSVCIFVRSFLLSSALIDVDVVEV